MRGLRTENTSSMGDITKRKKFIFLFGFAFLVVIADQLAKFIAFVIMPVGTATIPLIKNFLHITYIQNTGAAFGLFKGGGILLMIVAVAVILVILFLYKRIPRRYPILLFASFILGGTISNLIDRLFLGFVRDFIDFRIWPAFNIADACLTIGVIGLIVWMIWKK